jgi:hypothetical protein
MSTAEPPNLSVDSEARGPAQAAKPKRIVSEIAFPYGDLEDALRIAQTLHARFGYNCEPDQLAAQMGTDTKHSGFRVQLASARIFGAVDVGRGSVSLTELGARLADEQTEREARVEAFLHVPLYGRLYEAFRGRRLPGPGGLENEMKILGVSPRQLTKARVAFQRSAEQAGFFASGTDRLVRPANVPAPSATVSGDDPMSAQDQPIPNDYDIIGLGGLHPLLVGLIRTIPREGEPFSPKRQRQWLEAAKVNLALVFGSDDDDDFRAGRDTPDEARRDFAG